jgi:hypothetical protein
MPDHVYLRVHVWVRDGKRQAFADAIDGNLDNLSVQFDTDGSGPAWQWDQFVSGNGTWWGTSTQWRDDIAQSVMAAAAGSEAWYVAHIGGTVMADNFTPIPIPSGADFWACSGALGLVYVEPVE